MVHRVMLNSAEKGINIERLSFKKIFFHIDVLQKYFSTADAFPIHLVLGFTDYCNHNCIWCYTAYTTHNNMVVNEDGRFEHVEKGRDDRMIDPGVLLSFLAQARKKGLKAVTVVGSGEPLLHPQSAKMLNAIAELGIDFGVFTNGQIMNDGHLEVIANHGTFIRFSLDACDQDTYRWLHGASSDFDQTINNIKKLLDMRTRMGGKLPTVGVQFVTSHFNAHSMVPFTLFVRNLGVDYVSFKPMYNNPINTDRAKNAMPLKEILNKLDEVRRYETDNFKIYDKEGEQFINAWGQQEFNGACYYSKCMSHQFSPPVYANGDIYLCLNLGGRKEFVLGNIYKQSLEQIWLSKRRAAAIASIDLTHKCPARCKLDPLNKIMWDISHPDPLIHPNFI